MMSRIVIKREDTWVTLHEQENLLSTYSQYLSQIPTGVGAVFISAKRTLWRTTSQKKPMRLEYILKFTVRFQAMQG